MCLPLGFPTALPSGLFLKNTLTPLGGPTGGPTGGWRLSMGGPTGGWGLSDGRANGRVATLRWEAKRESRRKHHVSGSIRTADIQVQLGVNTTTTTTTSSTTTHRTHTRNSSVPHWQLAAEYIHVMQRVAIDAANRHWHRWYAALACSECNQ